METELNDYNTVVPPLFLWFEFKREYGNRADIVALFYYEYGSKVSNYFAQLYIKNIFGSTQNCIEYQLTYLQQQITDFRKIFPQGNYRLPGNYFDDLCQLDMDQCSFELQRLKNERLEQEKELDDFLKGLERSSNPEGEIPDVEFKSETQKIAWLYELGVLDLIVNKFKVDETYNMSRAAKVVNSFSKIHSETIRKALEAIYKPNEHNKKNNPLNNPETNIALSALKLKFDIE